LIIATAAAVAESGVEARTKAGRGVAVPLLLPKIFLDELLPSFSMVPKFVEVKQ